MIERPGYQNIVNPKNAYSTWTGFISVNNVCP